MTDFLEPIHSELILGRRQILAARSYFDDLWGSQRHPIYGSVDLRDAGWKMGIVDTNAFPSGFNNIHPNDHAALGGGLRDVLRITAGQHLLLVPENHTRNPNYVDHLFALQSMLLEQGFVVSIGSPFFPDELEILDGSDEQLPLSKISYSVNGELLANGSSVDSILLNADLSEGNIPNFGQIPVRPPIALGWHIRRKSRHHQILDPILSELGALMGIDPWRLGPLWETSEDRCLSRSSCLSEVAALADQLLERIAEKYQSEGISETPTVFVKNDRGTYGLGILSITSGSDLLGLSQRKLNRLTYSKGGSKVEDFIIQEGIPTRLMHEGEVAEVVMCCSAGSPRAIFLRASRKDARSNLNSASARFIPLPMNRCMMPSLANFLAESAMLAMSRELEWP